MIDGEYHVRWRCWAECDVPDTAGRVYESTAVVLMPTGSEIAACVVWQMASNNDRGVGLWTEDRVVVEIVEPADFAGHYAVEIEIKCKTRGREMTTDELREMYSEVE